MSPSKKMLTIHTVDHPSTIFARVNLKGIYFTEGPLLSTFFNKSVKTLLLTGVTYEIEWETLYFVFAVDAIPSWSKIMQKLNN